MSQAYFSARYLCTYNTNPFQKHFRKRILLFFSSNLRGGTVHSHPKRAQKMENSICSCTKGKRHIFQDREHSCPIRAQQVELLHKVSLHLQSKGFMQCSIWNGKLFFLTFFSPPRPDISFDLKPLVLGFLCASQMVPRAYQEKRAGNFLIYAVRIRPCKPNRHRNNCLVLCSIPSIRIEHILAPYFEDLSAKNPNFKKSFKNWRQGRRANTQLRWWTLLMSKTGVY